MSPAKDIGSTVTTFNSLALGRDEECEDPKTKKAYKVPASTLLGSRRSPTSTGPSTTRYPTRSGVRRGPVTDALVVRENDLQTT
jgi:hypothetical protein